MNPKKLRIESFWLPVVALVMAKLSEHIDITNTAIYSKISVNYPSPKGNGLLRACQLYLRSLIFKFPPETSGNPYSYGCVHVTPTV